MSYKSNLKEYDSKKPLELNYNSMQVEPPYEVFIPRIVADMHFFLYHV